MIRTIFAALAAVALTAGAASAQQSVADFYKGKSIDLYIGYTQGGGYDLYARFTAKHMEKHIPGNPNIVPRQMVGAGGQKAAAYVYEVAPKDGTVLAATAQELPLEQALGTMQIKFDSTKVNWIGNPSVDNNVVTMWHTSGVKSVEDAKQKQYVMASTGASSSSAQYPQVMNTLMGTKFKILSGYPGGRDMDLAMERGEVHGRGSQAYASYKSTQPDWLRDKKVIFIAQVGLKKEAELPDVPLLMDLASNPDDKAALRLLSTPTAVGRPLYTTPGVPAERVAALRRAYDLTIKDPAYLADMKKAGLEVNSMSGEELQKLAQEVVSTPKPIVERLLKAIEGRDIVEMEKKDEEKGKGAAK
jgi:tripartite-type tricarboxylate transporter receptor subunit TctC